MQVKDVLIPVLETSQSAGRATIPVELELVYLYFTLMKFQICLNQHMHSFYF